MFAGIARALRHADIDSDEVWIESRRAVRFYGGGYALDALLDLPYMEWMREIKHVRAELKKEEERPAALLYG